MQTFPRVHLYLAFFLTFATWAIYQTAPSQNQDSKKNSSLTRTSNELLPPLNSEVRLKEKLSVTEKITVKNGDSLATIFETHDISPSELQKLMKLDSISKEMKNIS